MIRQPRDAMMAMVAALRERRSLSVKTLSRTEDAAAKLMESDAWQLLTNCGEHPSGNAHLWMDERGHVHVGSFP